MDGDQTPAGVLDAPQDVEVRETPVTPEPTQGTSGQTEAPAKADKSDTASPADQTAAQQQAQPDISTLLQNEETRKALLDHPEIKKEIEHRFKSTRDADIQARVQAELARLQEQQKADKQLRDEEAQLREQLQQPDYELPEGTRKILQTRLDAIVNHRQQAEQQQQWQQLYAQADVQAKAATADELYRMEVLDNPDLTDAEKAELNWRDGSRYTSMQQWREAVRKAVVKKEAEKMSSEIVKKEVAAQIAAHLQQQRKAEDSPPQMPQGGTAKSDDEFIADLASGKSNDTARMYKKMKEWGI